MRNVEIDWHLTYRCNLNCKHCCIVDYREQEWLQKEYFPFSTREELDYYTLKKFVKILSNSNEFNIRVHFSPNVGESLMHKDFINIWNEVAELKNCELSLTSNGVLLQPHLRKMKVDSLKNIIISLDGGEEKAHTAMRGEGTFERTLKTLREIDALKSADKDFYLQINTVITRLNINSLSNLPLLLEDFESENITWNILKLGTDRGNAKKNRNMLEVSLEETKDHLLDIISSLTAVNERRKRRGKSPIKLRLSQYTLKEQFILLSSYQNKIRYSEIAFDFFKGCGRSCGAYNLQRIFVDPFGNLFPCFNFADPDTRQEFLKYSGYILPPNFCEENYKNLESVFSHKFFKEAQKWIEEIYGKIYCNSCPLKNTCTVCPAYAYLWGVPDECKKS